MSLRIGTGAGFSGDRISPAVDIARKGNIDFLVFECLAERTIAHAQMKRLADAEAGYDPLLEKRMTAVLPVCVANGIRIITNMGAANPQAAAERTRSLVRRLGLKGLRIAAVCGDDVLDTVVAEGLPLDEIGKTATQLGESLISANAYLGAAPIVDALEEDADVVITGRVADAALFLAPQILTFGWEMDDWERLGKGTVTGHLLECAAQVTGGYFADPGVKNVPNLANLGFPLAEIEENGNAVIGKTPGSGGCVTEATCKEQLLYEVHDPTRYIQPDVVANFSSVDIKQIGADRVAISGGGGNERTGLLKVSVGYMDAWVGEGQISYAGPNAAERGWLALDILKERFCMENIHFIESRGELIGLNSILGNAPHSTDNPSEVRLRFIARSQRREDAEYIGHEVESLYLNGPAGGGGATKNVQHILAITSALLPANRVFPTIEILEC